MTERTLGDLEKCYTKATQSGAEVFTFQGREVLTSYAKYLIEYLKTSAHRSANDTIQLTDS